MNQTRTFLLLGLLLVAYLLWTGWEQQFNAPIAVPPPAASTGTLAPQASAAPALVSAVPSAPAPTAESAAPAAALLPGSGAAHGQRIMVHTDVLDITLDTAGGALVQARLLKYAVAPEQTPRVSLLDDSASHYLVAQSGLVSSIAGAAPVADALFKSARTSYSMTSGQKQLNVDLTWSDPAQGIAVTKRYTFTRGSYVVQVQEQVRNLGKTPWTGNAWTQLVRTAPPAPPSHLFFLHDPSEYYSFTGGSWYSPQDKFSKLAFDEFAKHPLAFQLHGHRLPSEVLQHLADARQVLLAHRVHCVGVGCKQTQPAAVFARLQRQQPSVHIVAQLAFEAGEASLPEFAHGNPEEANSTVAE